MIIKGLKYENFRNLKDNHIIPSEKMNVIIGDNGQGKTNLLESIWMFNGVRSFRGSKDKDLIAFGKNSAKIEIDFFSEERLQNARLEFINGKRDAYINDIKKSAPSYLMGKITSIVFSPEHLSLIKDGPNIRRKFIDSAICQVKPKYSVYLARYTKVLNQRNALLKDISYYSELADTLEIWDRELAVNGSIIISERLKYISEMSLFAEEYHSGISENKEKLELLYKNKYTIQTPVQKIAEDFMKMLVNVRNDDLQLKYTTKGPHRDDIEIKINGRNSRQYASQGQQRSAVLSLKLAEATLVDQITGQQPVILLDDVLSELDKARQNFLLNKIKDRQVFITCCDYSTKDIMESGKLFIIKDGKVIEKNI
ncbi:MAG: DNA replication/repair protein RecF [Acutalibacteraceae bacterium]|nr:DNA replication/repair protein RecF [Acutalibacteraceae bacterium]